MCRRASISGSVLSAALLLLTLLSAASLGAGEELPCYPPCGVNGECVAYLGNLSCQCIGNWSGSDCSVSICERDNPCLNNGTCSYNPADPSQFLCSCNLPYFGDTCQYTTEVDNGTNSCEVGNPCNGSTCYNLASGGHQCFCMDGKWGVGCKYTVCELKEDQCPFPVDRCARKGVLCTGHGTCIWDDDSDSTYRSRCLCEPGWDSFNNCSKANGVRMQCKNNGACGDHGECVYILPEDYDGEDEELIFEDYECICDGEHQGRNCSESFDICSPDPCVSGTCNATHDGHYFKCICPHNRTGHLCENFIDPCASLACQNGGNCTTLVPPNPDGSYSSPEAWCSCCTGFTGGRCEMSTDNHTLCRPNPCRNGGECQLLSDTSYNCECGEEYTGVNCELPNLCLLEATCNSDTTEVCLVAEDDGEVKQVCICTDGWGGDTCTGDVDECLGSSAPLCLNGGTCVNNLGGYSCRCTPEYTGPECKDYVPQPVNCSSTNQMCKNGGECMDQGPGVMVCNCTKGFTGDFCEIVACQHDYCEELGRNSQCDLECFNEECGYDGREGLCLPNNTQDPWENCPQPAHCRQRANNSQCDPDCNTRDCLYDFHECVPSPEECPADITELCQNQTGNGNCDESCNTAKCPYDSGDCNSRKYLRDRVVVYILGSAGQTLSQNKDAQRRFEEAIGAITNTNPVIETVELLSEKQGEEEKIDVPEGQNLYRVTLRLDTEYCSDQCINSVEEAVKFLNAYYASGNKDIAGFSYVRSDTEEGPTEGPTSGTTSSTVTAIAVTFIVVAFLGLFVVGGVLVGKKRKVIRAKIFYPGQSQVDDSTHDRSPPNKKRKVAQTDLASGTLVSSTEESSITASCASGDYIRDGSKAAKMEGSSKITWADYKVPVGDSPGHDPSDVAVVSQIGKDSRKWNYLHYSAVRNPEIMRGLLEKCRGDDSKKWDVNTPGPGGYTPLMLAVTQKSSDSFPLPSRSSSSSESSGEHTEHNGLLFSPMTKAMQFVPHSDTSSPSGSFTGSPFNCSVDVLISTRVKLDATNDYGRTGLHLAAVCARGDYVKKLLAAGANPNVQDNWGQSALHAAIGAAAEGAFQMLLDFPKTDINLKSDGGITPLMDAVKTTNMYMVKQLVKKNADISLADYEGRTAVHWAAMTENVEALKLLIRQGPDTIKDTQDNKGQTALFLACREGATECTRHLLDVFANATLLDNLDRSPMTIAFERQHLYIMEMLKSHGPYHYQLPASGRHGTTVPHHVQMAHQHHEMALRQQQQMSQQQAYAAYPHPPTSHHNMMVEMQSMPPALEHYPGPEMQLPPRGQTFGDVGYPVSSSMDLGLPGSASFKQMNTSLFFSNHATENGGIHTPTAAIPQHFYPPSTSSQLPVTSAEHPSPPTTYHQHSSPPTLVPTTMSDLQPTAIPTSYSQPHPVSCGVDPTTASYSAYPTSAGHFPVTSSTSDSEQRMVSELITSISDSSPPQQQLHSPPQQQPHSASSVHSNRSPSAFYPSPPNSDTLQHSSEVAQQNGLMAGAYHHASPPSLTPSPEGRDETQHNITTIEGLVQQHDYPSVLYGGAADSYNYGGIRFTQDYSTETTV